MNNILNAQEAFTAIHNGKTVLCRFAGNGALPADKDFSTLDQMPAMVFVWPNYEFCIQVEMVELAGFKFTKPLTLDDVKPDQDVFVFQSTGDIHHCKYDESNEDIVSSISGGFAQSDIDNAIKQYRAYCALMGCDYRTTGKVIEIRKEYSPEAFTPIADNALKILGGQRGRFDQELIRVRRYQFPVRLENGLYIPDLDKKPSIKPLPLTPAVKKSESEPNTVQETADQKSPTLKPEIPVNQDVQDKVIEFRAMVQKRVVVTKEVILNGEQLDNVLKSIFGLDTTTWTTDGEKVVQVHLTKTEVA